jgi:hypothetical protein
MKGEESMNIKKRECYVCPKCGSDITSIEDYEMDIDCLYLKMACQDCDATWSEYTILTYDGCVVDGQQYDKDGKEND